MKKIICFFSFLLSGCDFFDNSSGFLEPKFKGTAYIINLESNENSNKRLSSELKSFGVDCEKLESGAASSVNPHRKIWQKIAEGNETQAMVLEDNVYFEKGFKRKFFRYIQDLPEDWDIAFLVIGRDNKYGFTPVGDIFRDIDEVQSHPYVAQIQKANRVYGLYGYVVNKRGAKKLLKLTENVEGDVNDIIFQKGGVNTGYVTAYVSMFKLLEPKLSKADIDKAESRFRIVKK